MLHGGAHDQTPGAGVQTELRFIAPHDVHANTLES